MVRGWRSWIVRWLGRGCVVGFCVTAVGLFAFVSVARADGDPASDYLVARQVFVSSQEVVESPAQRELLATVGAANRAGFAIRVAIISSDYDLGSITALWRRPGVYARFLGLELSAGYRGRLLVVMPNGFGFNWPAHSGRSASRLLANVPLTSSTEDALLLSALAAVRALAAADGITLPSARQIGQPRHAGALAGGGVIWLPIIGALVVLAVLVVLGRRWRGRRVGPRLQRSPPANGVRGARWRLALPGVVVLCGIAIGAPILVLAVVRNGGGASTVNAGSIVTPPAVSWSAGQRSAPGFVLRDQRGRRVSVAAYRGRPVVVTFIDPLCRNLCPLEAKVLNDVVGRMPSAQRPEILAVSVDVYAGADRRANLLQDVHSWRLVPQWRWAVGSPAQLAAVWRRYGVGVKVTTRRIEGRTIDYITHTEAAFVVDGSGHERALFFWPFYPQDVQRTLRQLL